MSVQQLIRHATRRTNLIFRQTWSACLRPFAGRGSAAWLIGTELKYGGYVTGVRRGKVSPKDPRTPEELAKGGMIGGDRMLHHGYAPKYAQYLRPFIASGRPVTLAEFGILKGTGLAIWSDLFPTGRILGFDIDLDHFKNNIARLRSLGAFANSTPEVYDYDQFDQSAEYLRLILAGDAIDICIDDGFHSSESILTTFESVRPSIAAKFVYFIEDNRQVYREISALYPEYSVECCGQLTVVTPRVTNAIGLIRPS